MEHRGWEKMYLDEIIDEVVAAERLRICKTRKPRNNRKYKASTMRYSTSIYRIRRKAVRLLQERPAMLSSWKNKIWIYSLIFLIRAVSSANCLKMREAQQHMDLLLDFPNASNIICQFLEDTRGAPILFACGFGKIESGRWPGGQVDICRASTFRMAVI